MASPREVQSHLHVLDRGSRRRRQSRQTRPVSYRGPSNSRSCDRETLEPASNGPALLRRANGTAGMHRGGHPARPLRRAAGEPRRSQPASSETVRNLERELGVDPRHRTTEAVAVRPRGARFRGGGAASGGSPGGPAVEGRSASRPHRPASGGSVLVAPRDHDEEGIRLQVHDHGRGLPLGPSPRRVLLRRPRPSRGSCGETLQDLRAHSGRHLPMRNGQPLRTPLPRIGPGMFRAVPPDRHPPCRAGG